MCRSRGNDVEPGHNHRGCPVDETRETTHRSFPMVIIEGAVLIDFVHLYFIFLQHLDIKHTGGGGAELVRVVCIACF